MSREEESEEEAGRRNDAERNDRAGREINAAADARRAEVAELIVRCLAAPAGVELSAGELATATGASLTYARGAVAVLLAAGRIVMCTGGYYSAAVAS